MGRFYIWTMGCQMNKADSQALAQGLEARGHASITNPEEADLIVVNACVVRQGAEDRALNRLAMLKPLKKNGHGPIIALTGCLVPDFIGAALRRRLPHVDFFLKPGEVSPLLEAFGTPGPEPAPSPLAPTAFVPVIQGCDNFCTYCIVPYRRGRERSQPLEEVACQVQALVARGIREVTLVGQNVDAYGHDLPGRPDLADLLALLNSIPGLARLRFLTSHPRDMTERLIQTVARLEKVCPHICLPVQAGDDSILQAMGRGYTSQEYGGLVARIRQAVPDVALSTDIIVGFPGETEAQFLRTLNLLQEIRFDAVHVAAYSPRPGTLAARTLLDDVPAEVKRERLHGVEALQERVAAELNATYVGQVAEVLVEGERKGKSYGRTRTDKLAFFPQPRYYRGQVVDVKIERASAWSLQGVVK